MRIIYFIEDSERIKKILKRLGLWDVRRKVPPLAHGPPIKAYNLDDGSPIPCLDDYLIDAGYPVEAYL